MYMAKNPDIFPVTQAPARQHLSLDIFDKKSTIQIVNGIRYFATSSPNISNSYGTEEKHGEIRHTLFEDMIVLSGYLLINLITVWVVLSCTKKEIPPAWAAPIIHLSIPRAISIHTVTAFIYAGFPGRSFWLTAIMAPWTSAVPALAALTIWTVTVTGLLSKENIEVYFL